MVLHPVGPHEPRVYWTRRAVLLLAIILVIVLFAAYACSGGDAKPAAGRVHPPSSTPTPTATSTPTTASTVCSKDELTVAIGTDATTYPAGVLPHLTATIRTTGTAPCSLPVSAISWVVVSGPDTVYTTAGCPVTSRSSFTVRPNHPLRTARIWGRHRSVHGCATPGAAAAAGTYQARVTVAGLQSGAAVFHLTG
jgi:hypothetical protein